MQSSPIQTGTPHLAMAQHCLHSGEIWGKLATEECAAVCWCCPCGLVNLIVLAVYKLLAGLCRKALRRKRHRRLMKKGLLPGSRRSRCESGCDGMELQIHPVVSTADKVLVMSMESGKDVMELEKEMLERFYGTGYWRSPSQRASD